MARKTRTKKKNIWFEWVLPIGITVIVALFIRAFVFYIGTVPTASMNPTIQEKDRLLITRVYEPENLTRGEIVVFKFDRDGKDEQYVKRLIGKPGDRVELKSNGDVHVNGVKIRQDYIKDKDYTYGKDEKYEVPEDSYFFLGDNRERSNDSRFWTGSPYIDGKDIIGKPLIRIWPLNKLGNLD